MKLYDYLKSQLLRADPHPAIDHEIRTELHADGRISFYIHARGRDSDTPVFWISDAGIFEKCESMSPRAEFLSHPKEWRDAKMEAMANALADGGYLGAARGKCEGCGEPATTGDSEGIPLCEKCAAELDEATKAEENGEAETPRAARPSKPPASTAVGL